MQFFYKEKKIKDCTSKLVLNSDCANKCRLCSYTS